MFSPPQRNLLSITLLLIACLMALLLTVTSHKVAHATPLAQAGGQNLQFIDAFGGHTTNVIVDGNYAYAIVDARLVVIDISNPTTPTEVGSMQLSYYVYDMAVMNGFLYLATNSLRIISISDPSYPVEVGNFNNFQYPAQWLRSIAVEGHYVFVLEANPDYTESIQVIDVARPASPVKVGTYTHPVQRFGLPSLIAVRGKYVYTSGFTKNYLLTVDVSNPRNPQFVSYLDEFSPDRDLTIQDLMVLDGTVYLASWNHSTATNASYALLEGIDVSNPSDPRRSSVLTSSIGFLAGIAAIDHYIYWGGGRDLNEDNEIQVVDISNPEQPVMEKSLDFRSASFVIANNRLYSASRKHTLQIYDLSTPLMPTLLSNYLDGGISEEFEQLIIYDNRLYASGGNALQVVDLTNQRDIIGSLAITGSLFALDHNKAYLAWSENRGELGDCYGFHAIDITNPSSLTLKLTYLLGCSNHWPDPIHIQAITEGRLYASDLEGKLHVFDLTTSITPTLLGKFEPYGRTTAGVGNYAYIADWLSGITILDVSGPTTPTVVGSFPTADPVFQFAVFNHYLLALSKLPTSGSELHILDISNPTELVELGKIFLVHGASSFTAEGDYLYTVDPILGVSAFDITNPNQPLAVANYPKIPGRLFTQIVANSDHTLYLSSEDYGISVLKLSGAVAGKVIDSFGKPYTGVKVSLSNGQTTETNVQGDYSFASLIPGSYTVKVESLTYDFQPAEQTLPVPSYPSDSVNFTLLLKPFSTAVTPDAPAHLSYTDLVGNELAFDMPAGVVVQPTTLSVLPQAFASAPGQFFTGVRFDLQTGEASNASSNFTFTAPLTITIHYTNSAVAPVTDRNQLMLRWWNGSQWTGATTTCAVAIPALHNLESQVLTTTVCQSGQFALFGPTVQHFLPLVSRSPVATSEMRGRFVAQHSGKCLNVLAESQQNGANIIQWPCVGGDNEIWAIRSQGEYAQIVAKHSQKCLNVSNVSQVEGAQVIQYSCSGGDNELWRLLPVGDNLYQIVAKHSNQCLTVQDASQEDKVQVIQRACSESQNQTWRFQAAN